MRRNAFIRTFAIYLIAGIAMLTGAPSTFSQNLAGVPFYYPVAVGGPIAKTIDGFAEGFMKENPGIKLTPIYAGTYQESS
jgi:sn-glycerol 3-phosphate transport system substrate-binding protein